MTENLSAEEKERDALANELWQAKQEQLAASKLAEAKFASEVQKVAATKESEIQELNATLDVGIVASPQPAVAGISLAAWRNDSLIVQIPASWEAPETVLPDWLSGRRWAFFAQGTQIHGLIASWFGQAAFNPRPFFTMNYPGM